MNTKCVFSAPHSFLGEIKKQFDVLLHTEFREIWDPSELTSSTNLICWVVNPGQRFVINKNILELFPNIELIVTPSTGKNHINENDCKNKNVKVLGLLDIRPILDSITESSDFNFLLSSHSLVASCRAWSRE